ncbi:MAG: DUF2207 domain-containing protein [Planctomycetia bacterium]|nr:DUF2207 domain-containing protein [Planctomycetia bacterium]
MRGVTLPAQSRLVFCWCCHCCRCPVRGRLVFRRHGTERSGPHCHYGLARAHPPRIFFLVWLANLTSLWLIPLVLGIVTTVAVFYEILKAPTISGRAVMDKIAGLRMYLDTAEQDRLEAHTQQALNQSQGLPRTLELFEYFLPYAVALDVANQWAEQFKDIIEAASIDTKSGSANTYHPAWYHGNDWSTASIGAAAAGLGTAMTSAVVAAATSPTSSGSGDGYSGGGGGGFSGGGGGGGGGGGW